MVIHPVVVEKFQSRSKWWDKQPTDNVGNITIPRALK